MVIQCNSYGNHMELYADLWMYVAILVDHLEFGHRKHVLRPFTSLKIQYAVLTCLEVWGAFALGRGVLHAMPQLRGRRSQFQHYARLRDSK